MNDATTVPRAPGATAFAATAEIFSPFASIPVAEVPVSGLRLERHRGALLVDGHLERRAGNDAALRLDDDMRGVYRRLLAVRARGGDIADDERARLGALSVQEYLDRGDLGRVQLVALLEPVLVAEDDLADLRLARLEVDVLGVPGIRPPVAVVVHAQPHGERLRAGVLQRHLDVPPRREVPRAGPWAHGKPRPRRVAGRERDGDAPSLRLPRHPGVARHLRSRRLGRRPKELRRNRRIFGKRALNKKCGQHGHGPPIERLHPRHSFRSCPTNFGHAHIIPHAANCRARLLRHKKIAFCDSLHWTLPRDIWYSRTHEDGPFPD